MRRFYYTEVPVCRRSKLHSWPTDSIVFARHSGAFHVSVDARGWACTDGIQRSGWLKRVRKFCMSLQVCTKAGRRKRSKVSDLATLVVIGAEFAHGRQLKSSLADTFQLSSMMPCGITDPQICPTVPNHIWPVPILTAAKSAHEISTREMLSAKLDPPEMGVDNLHAFDAEAFVCTMEASKFRCLRKRWVCDGGHVGHCG